MRSDSSRSSTPFRRLTLRLTGVALAMLLAAPAFATVRYVSPTGLDTNSGTSPLSPWTLSKANASLVGGDICNLLPGTYATSVNPVNSGAAGSRICYVGAPLLPGTVVVTGISIKKNYITVIGVRSTGDIALDYPARYDSVAYCQSSSGAHFYGVKYSIIARCSITGQVSFLLDLAQTISGTSNCEYDTLRGNTINLGAIPASHGFKIRGYTQNCLIDSNRVTGTFTQTGTNDGVGRIFYNSSYNTLRDNYWQFDATNDYNANRDPWNGFVLRDSANHYLFERDTVMLGTTIGGFKVRGVLCSSGTYPNSVADNTWDQCVMKSNSYFWIQNGLRRCLIQRSVIASQSDNALWFLYSLESSQLRHNTLFSGGQVVKFEDAHLGTGNEMTSNIFYSVGAGPVGTGGAQTQYASNATTNLTSNNNLYFSRTFTTTPGDRSIEWCCYTGSRPGTGMPWNNLNGQDGASKYGSPMLMDSSFATLDAHLLPGSLAKAIGVGGSDAGAYPAVPVGPDVTPPGTVVNLATGAVTDRSVALSWTAPGDDGASGVVAAYDLRYSLSPITASNFTSATSVTIQPAPVLGGTAQTYVALNLTTNLTYYFALRARDEAGNWSGVSNSPSGIPRDMTPPATINDLGTGP